MPSATARRPEPQSWLRPKAVALLGYAGLHRGLASRVLALARCQDLAKDDLVHFVGGNVGTLESGLDRDGAELMGGCVGEGAVERADRRTRRADDDNICCSHEQVLLV